MPMCPADVARRVSTNRGSAPMNGKHQVIGGMGVQTMLKGGTEDTI